MDYDNAAARERAKARALAEAVEEQWSRLSAAPCQQVCRTHGITCQVDHRPRELPGFHINHEKHGHVVMVDGRPTRPCRDFPAND